MKWVWWIRPFDGVWPVIGSVFEIGSVPTDIGVCPDSEIVWLLIYGLVEVNVSFNSGRGDATGGKRQSINSERRFRSASSP